MRGEHENRRSALSSGYPPGGRVSAIDARAYYRRSGRVCVTPQNYTTGGFRFSFLLTDNTQDVRFERLAAG